MCLPVLPFSKTQNKVCSVTDVWTHWWMSLANAIMFIHLRYTYIYTLHTLWCIFYSTNYYSLVQCYVMLCINFICIFRDYITDQLRWYDTCHQKVFGFNGNAENSLRKWSCLVGGWMMVDQILSYGFLSQTVEDTRPVILNNLWLRVYDSWCNAFGGRRTHGFLVGKIGEKWVIVDVFPLSPWHILVGKEQY